MSKTVRKNIVYLSRLRAISCIAIVILHTFYAFDSLAGNLSQHTAMMNGRNLMTWAVPCFVMVSGALLLAPERKVTFKKLFGQYILRIILALLIFTVLFSVFDKVFTPSAVKTSLFGDIVSDIFYGTGWKHMWYLYMMFALYLLLPFYRMITKSALKNELLYLLAVYFVFMSVLPVYTAFSGRNTAFYICVSTVYPMYLFAGHVIHSKMIKLNVILSVILLAVYTALTLVFTSVACKGGNQTLDSLLGNYGFPVTIAGALGMYSIFRATEKQDWKIIDKILLGIDKCSFGIYLIHMAVLKYVLAVVKFNPFQNGGIPAVILVVVGVFVVSYLITFVLRLIPFVKKVL